jgi:hypothetical protein
MAETVISIKAKTEQAQQALKEFSTSIKDSADEAAKFGKTAGIAFAALSGAIALSVASFAEAEEVSNSLDQALVNQGVFTTALRQRYDELASSIQDKTKMDDDSVKKGFATLQAQLGQIEITGELADAVANLAVKTGDYDSAAAIVAKTVGTSKNAMKEYGIDVDTTGTKQEKLAQIIQGVNDKFSGQAEAVTRGLGVFAQLKNSLGDVAENLGQQFAPAAEAAARMFKDFVDKINENPALFKIGAILIAAATAFAGLVAAGAGAVVMFSTVATAAATLSIPLLGITAVVGGVIAVIAGLAIAWNTNFLGIQEITAGVLAATKEIIFAFAASAGDVMSGFGKILIGALTFDRASITEGYRQLKEAITTQFSGVTKAYREGHNERLAQIEAEKTADVEGKKKEAESAANAERAKAAAQRKTFAEKKELQKAAEDDAIKAEDERAKREQKGLELQLKNIEDERIAEADSSQEIEDALADQIIILESMHKAALEHIDKEKIGYLEKIEKKKTAEEELAASIETLRDKAEEAEKKRLERVKAYNKQLSSDPTSALFPSDGFESPLSEGQQAGYAAGLGGLSKVLSGRSGAISMASSIGAGISESFAPGTGAIAGTVIGKLAEGPEATKKFIKEFVEAIPDIMDAVAESLPVVVEVLVDTLINEGGIERISFAFVRAMAGEGILKNLGEQLGIDMGNAFNGDVVAEKISGGFTVFAQGIQDLAKTLTDGAAALFGGIQSGVTAIGQFFAKDLPGYIAASFKFVTDFFTVGNLTEIFTAPFNGLIRALESVQTFFKDTFPEASKTISGLFKPFTDAIAVFKKAVEDFIGAPSKAVKGVTGGGSGVDTAKRLQKAILTGGASEIPGVSIPGFANGGIVQPLYAATGMIVPYIPRGGDTVPVMTKPGELIMNEAQQANIASKLGGAGGVIKVVLEGRGFMKDLIENSLVEMTALGTGRIRVAVGSEA